MRDAALAFIERAKEAALYEMGPVVDVLTTTAPVPVDTTFADPNSLVYSGRPDQHLLPMEHQ